MVSGKSTGGIKKRTITCHTCMFKIRGCHRRCWNLEWYKIVLFVCLTILLLHIDKAVKVTKWKFNSQSKTFSISWCRLLGIVFPYEELFYVLRNFFLYILIEKHEFHVYIGPLHHWASSSKLREFIFFLGGRAYWCPRDWASGFLS